MRLSCDIFIMLDYDVDVETVTAVDRCGEVATPAHPQTNVHPQGERNRCEFNLAEVQEAIGDAIGNRKAIVSAGGAISRPSTGPQR